MDQNVLKDIIIQSEIAGNPEITDMNSAKWNSEGNNKYICTFKDEHDKKYMLKVYGGNDRGRIKKVYERLDGLADSKKEIFFPRVHKSWEQENYFCVIEEFITGKTLEEYIYEEDGAGKASVMGVIRLMKRICDAVKPLHDFQPAIVHRDIAPKNIIVDTEGFAWLIDFDIAYEEGTGSDGIKGTPGYMASEVSNSTPCVMSDVYSIGVILKNWIEAWNLYDKIDARSKQELKCIVEKCMKNNAEERYEKTDYLKQALFKVEILCLLRASIKKLESDDVLVFAYESDTIKKLEEMRDKIESKIKERPETLYAVLDKKTNHSLVFSIDAIYSIRPKKGGHALGKDSVSVKKLLYKNVVAVNPKDEVKKKKPNLLAIVEKRNKDWYHEEWDMARFETEEVSSLISSIIECRESLYERQEILKFYAANFREAKEVLDSGERDKLNMLWNVVIALGEIHTEYAGQEYQPECKPGLQAVYSNKKDGLSNEFHLTNNKKEKTRISHELTLLEKKINKLEGKEESEEVKPEYESDKKKNVLKRLHFKKKKEN